MTEVKRIGYTWDEFQKSATRAEIIQAKRAFANAGIAEEEYDKCTIVAAEGYYNIVKSNVTWDTLINGIYCYPFDAEHIYPLQRIGVIIQYCRGY
ncbi:hypothetical protein [Pumilibacter muris]|uniref:hypothetical protein n=1 Tax=Pumilibacter muris TaxID=2941510 RepID=UPI0020416005|nr:hypothetical protein [Pumilibacter muris]